VLALHRYRAASLQLDRASRTSTGPTCVDQGRGCKQSVRLECRFRTSFRIGDLSIWHAARRAQPLRRPRRHRDDPLAPSHQPFPLAPSLARWPWGRFEFSRACGYVGDGAPLARSTGPLTSASRVTPTHSTFHHSHGTRPALAKPTPRGQDILVPKGTELVTLNGLCQQVEGGSCGIWMFRQVRDVIMMDGLTRGFNQCIDHVG
jgi:hypothetical protein